MATTGPNPNAPIETTDAPVDNTLQPPAEQAPAQQPMQLQPAQQQPPAAQAPAPPQEPPGTHFKNLSHALQGAVLGALAGGKKVLGRLAGPSEIVDGYETDESGKQTPKYRQLHTGDKLQRIAQAALQGLAAGSSVPQQKSGAASWAAGIGAGASQQINEEKQEDLLKRQQSKEAFEQEQKAMTDKYIRAQHNITTHALFQKGVDDTNEHDPERQKTEAIRGAAEDYISRNPSTSMTAQVISESEARAMQAADKNNPASTTHVFFPYGMRAAKQDGKEVYEKDGVTPKKEGQLLVIGGGTKDGKMPLPQPFVDDLKKYGKLAGITGLDTVKAGDEWALDRFLNAGSRMNPVKGQEIDGWKEKKLGENAVRVEGKWMQENSFTHERRPYGGTPQETDKINAQIDKDQAEAEKFRAEAAKARSESTGAEDTITAQGTDLVEGDMVPSLQTKRSKDFNKIYKAARDYSIKKYGVPFDYEKADRDYKFASNVGTQNTLKYLNSLTGNAKDGTTGILDQLIAISDGLKRSKYPALNDLDAWQKLQKDDPSYIPLFNFATDAADQFAKIMQGGGTGGGGTSDKKIEQGMAMFRRGFGKNEMRVSATSTKSMLSTRKREMIGDNIYLLKDFGEPGWQERRQAARASGGNKAPSTNTPPPDGPPANLLKEGTDTTFQDGSVWRLQNGQPSQVKPPTKVGP